MLSKGCHARTRGISLHMGSVLLKGCHTKKRHKSGQCFCSRVKDFCLQSALVDVSGFFSKCMEGCRMGR